MTVNASELAVEFGSTREDTVAVIVLRALPDSVAYELGIAIDAERISPAIVRRMLSPAIVRRMLEDFAQDDGSWPVTT